MPKIRFHYTYIIICFGFVITGYFLNLFIFTSIILIHELGHFLMAKYLKQPVNKIIIYPYGGVTVLNSKLNLSINKELLIAIFGIIFQNLYFILIYIFYVSGFIRNYTYQLFYTYHYAILIFNLLPIIPLDGSKIFNLLLAKIFNYNLSNKINVIISIITLIIVIKINYYQQNYTLIIIFSYLITNIIKYYKNLKNIYYKFIFERYLYKFSFAHEKVINNYQNMYRDCHHYIYLNKHYYPEEDILKKKFDLR